jgi:uncharacterized protein DUF4189
MGGSGFAAVRARVCAVAAIVITSSKAGHAAGALAVGSCAAYGYAYDYSEEQHARAEALRKCTGECKVVATMQRGCAAYAIDMRNACGPHGYATGATLARAQNVALRNCYQSGGRDCVVRAFACEGGN